MQKRFRLTLYITGQTSRSQRAIANLRRICAEELANQFELRIVDILEYPHIAEEKHIFATPTLVRELPPPLRRIIGDLSDTEKVLMGLDVHPVC